MRAQLRLLATEKDLKLVKEAYLSYKAAVREQVHGDQLQLEPEDEAANRNFWGGDDLGVTHAKLPTAELNARLGIKSTGEFPFWNSWRHESLVPDDDGWVEPIVEQEKAGYTRLVPKWHQLAGTLQLLRNSYEGVDTLLADEAGVGKSAQVIALISCLAHHIESPEDVEGEFGGKYGVWT